MQEPPHYQMAFLYSIEGTVLNVREEFRKLLDADVEFVYLQLKKYYQELAKGKEAEEPLSSSERRQVLIDEILNIIDEREEIEADLGIINNPNITPDGKPIRSLAAFYVSGFSRLHKSVRLWSKEFGKTGYLNFIEQNVA